MGELLTNQATEVREAEPSLPGPILLLGAPGVGKGTQSQLLVDKFQIPQISTGDLLRANIAEGTGLGRAAKLLMDQGQLVPDDLVNDMVQERLQHRDVARGYILDGFPRTYSQAAWLDNYLSGTRGTPPLIAVKIQVPTDELLRRITGRRSCPQCKRIYNIYSHAPRVDELCDFDQTALVYRSDDTEGAFRERMKAYDALTTPVIDHYAGTGRFREVGGTGPVVEVHQEIVSNLDSLRRQFSSPSLER